MVFILTNMYSATSITEPCRPLEYYYNGEKSEDKNNCFQAKVSLL